MAAVTSTATNAQVRPVYSIGAPEASNLGIYGSVPVGMFTGVPEISVPLYEIRAGAMTFPISLDYHLSSVKPNKYPGIVGLGWSLQCGGCISRTVRGCPDEKMSGKNENGYYGNRAKMIGISGRQLDSLSALLTVEGKNDWIELSADEFSFNFFGHSGNFYLSPEGEWVVASDEDIRVEFDPESGFFGIDDLADRIPNVKNWINRENNRRHFKEFTLVTPDGCRFTFGGLYATDFSVPYYSRRTGDLVATSWHLSRIDTPDGRSISYTYERQNLNLLADIRYSPSKCMTSGIPSTGNSGVNTGRRGFTGFLLYPARLNRIAAPNETISFEYKADWRYQDAMEKHSGEALYWSENGFSRTSLYQHFDASPSLQFTYLFPGFDRSTDSEARSCITGKLLASALYGMKLDRKGGDDTTILFEYLEGSHRKLKRLAWRAGLVDISTTYSIGCGVAYPFYSIPKNELDIDMPEYRFRYDNGEMPDGYILPQADRWGYWNGRTHKFAEAEDFNAPYSLVATKSETLTEIIYPTGGSTVFEYEGNNYSKEENSWHQAQESYGISGGLRVRGITNLTRERKIVSSKLYHYSESLSPSAKSSGVARLGDPVSVSYNTEMTNYEWIPLYGSAGPYTVSMYISAMYGFGTPVTNLNSPDVGYSCVIEETLDSEGRSLGYVVNRFSNYGTDINGNPHNDEAAIYTFNCQGFGPGVPYTSNASERGRLLSRSWHRADGSEVRSETYRYTRVSDKPMLTATQRLVFFSTDPSNFIYAPTAWLTKTSTYSYLPESTVVREGEYSDSSQVRYNSSRQVVSESVVAGDGLTRTMNLTYPTDYPAQYGWMIDAHVISPVVTATVSSDGQKQVTRNTYSRTSASGSSAFYKSKVETEFESGAHKVDWEALSADEWGNPTEIVENGRHSVLQWCNSGQSLRTKVDGITLEKYESLPVKKSDSKPASADTIVFPGDFDPVCRNVDGLQAWSYTYDRSLKLTSATSPDGMCTCFEYDQLGRLTKSYYFEKSNDGKLEQKTLNKCEYHYHKD